MNRELKKFPESSASSGRKARREHRRNPRRSAMAEVTVVLKPRGRVAAPGSPGTACSRRWTRSFTIPACPTSGGCPSRRGPRCSRRACGARSASKVYGDNLERHREGAIAVEHARLEGARHAQRLRGTNRPAASTSISTSTARPQPGTVSASRTSTCGRRARPSAAKMSPRTVEGRERYPIYVRYAREYRDNPEMLGRVFDRRRRTARKCRSRKSRPSRCARPSHNPERRGQARRLRLRRYRASIADYVAEAKEVVARDVVLPPARGSNGSASSSTSNAPRSG